MPQSQFHRRIEIFCSFLGRARLRGWFSWRPDELQLQIGHYPHLGASFLLFLDSGERILFIPELEPSVEQLADTQVLAYPWGDPACADPVLELNRCLEDILRTRRICRKQIGYCLTPGQSSLPGVFAEESPISHRQLALLTSGMSSSIPLENAFLDLYLLKTQEEIDKIRIANRVALRALNSWREALLPGATKAEVAARAEFAVQSQTDDGKIRTARAWAMVQSGSNTSNSGRLNRSSGRRLESGDLVLIEMATCVNGYWSDLTRTETVGCASAFASELLDAVSHAQQMVLRILEPGLPARVAYQTARRCLDQAGFTGYFTHPLGHHVGFRYHDPGFRLAENSPEILRPGMVLTIEPGAYLTDPRIGARIEDNVAIHPHTVEILSRTDGKETHETD